MRSQLNPWGALHSVEWEVSPLWLDWNSRTYRFSMISAVLVCSCCSLLDSVESHLVHMQWEPPKHMSQLPLLADPTSLCWSWESALKHRIRPNMRFILCDFLSLKITVQCSLISSAWKLLLYVHMYCKFLSLLEVGRWVCTSYSIMTRARLAFSLLTLLLCDLEQVNSSSVFPFVYL